MTNNQNTEVRQLILDSAEKMFSDHCDKALLDAAERGEFSTVLWQKIVENGFDQLGTKASGTNAGDMYAFIKQCGRFAVPLPIADTLLVNCWCEEAGIATEGISSFGELNGDTVIDVNWGHKASNVASISRESDEVTIFSEPAIASRSQNMAGEPRDSIRADTSKTVINTTAPYAQAALVGINLMAGVLQTVLELGIQFAMERQQFGRAISKFQAIQHSLAIVASEVAAAQRAADAAVDALGDDRFVFEVAASKARVGEAVGVVAEQVHQIHGAMGFTHEHRLHHYSRRAWAWRDELGNEFYWQAILGNQIARLGADNAWAFIATRT